MSKELELKWASPDLIKELKVQDHELSCENPKNRIDILKLSMVWLFGSKKTFNENNSKADSNKSKCEGRKEGYTNN